LEQKINGPAFLERPPSLRLRLEWKRFAEKYAPSSPAELETGMNFSDFEFTHGLLPLPLYTQHGGNRICSAE